MTFGAPSRNVIEITPSDSSFAALKVPRYSSLKKCLEILGQRVTTKVLCCDGTLQLIELLPVAWLELSGAVLGIHHS